MYLAFCRAGACSAAIAFLTFASLGACFVAAPTMTFATAEREPYIGENLPNKGYVHEVITESLKRAGYGAEMCFYPFARAMVDAERGGKDGVAPVYFDESLTGKFAFSDPFPGDSVGLLKRKDTKAAFEGDPRKDLAAPLNALKAFSFGVMRGFAVAKEFDGASYLRKAEVHADEFNLKKLESKRIDLVVIDKFTAADLMVKKFPQ